MGGRARWGSKAPGESKGSNAANLKGQTFKINRARSAMPTPFPRLLTISSPYANGVPPSSPGLRLYANGVSSSSPGLRGPPSSPGLRGPRYPGSSPPRIPTPTGLRPGARTEPPWGSCVWSVDPRVGLISFGQPWAGGRNPFGIEDRGFSGARCYHADPIPTIVSDLVVIRQRRSVLQPRVARPALPWVISPTYPNPNGVASRRAGTLPLSYLANNFSRTVWPM
jgi:hypothetical protein